MFMRGGAASHKAPTSARSGRQGRGRDPRGAPRTRPDRVHGDPTSATCGHGADLSVVPVCWWRRCTGRAAFARKGRLPLIVPGWARSRIIGVRQRPRPGENGLTTITVLLPVGLDLSRPVWPRFLVSASSRAPPRVPATSPRIPVIRASLRWLPRSSNRPGRQHPVADRLLHRTDKRPFRTCTYSLTGRQGGLSGIALGLDGGLHRYRIVPPRIRRVPARRWFRHHLAVLHPPIRDWPAATVGVIVAMDTSARVHNAQGIARGCREMLRWGAQILTELVRWVNTTKASPGHCIRPPYSRDGAVRVLHPCGVPPLE